MVKDFKYIIRRILIGGGIALILGYIGSLTGFVIPLNVYAMEKPNITVGVDSTTDSSNVQLKYGLRSNVFKNDFNNSPNMQFGYTQYNVNINDLDSNNGVSVPFWDSFTQLSNSLEVDYRVSNYTGYNSYVDSLHFNPKGNVLLRYNNHYTLLLFFEKKDNIDYMNGYPNISLDTFKYYVGNDDTLIEGKDYISNISINYYRIYEKPTIPSVYSYILFDFDVTSSNFPIYQDNIYLSDITLSSDIGNINGSLKLPLDYFLETHRVGNNDNGIFGVDFYFVENGVFNVPGVTCNPSTGACHSGSQYSGVYDYTTTADIDVLESINTCPNEFSLESLICNVKRVFDIIFRLFVRFGNFINDFFDDVFYNYIEPQFGFDTGMTPVSDLLTMPITLINAFIDGVDGQCTPYVFGTLYDYQLHLPCINIKDILGVTLYTIIDGLCSIFMLFNIGSLIVTFFDKSTSLDDMFGLLYHVRDYNRQLASDEANGVVR